MRSNDKPGLATPAFILFSLLRKNRFELPIGIGPMIVSLDQQPLIILAIDADEHKFAAQL